MVHEALTDVGASFDDGLGVSRGLNGWRVACGVAIWDAGEEAMVDDTEFAEGGGGVVPDAGVDEVTDVCEALLTFLRTILKRTLSKASDGADAPIRERAGPREVVRMS